MTKKIDEPTIKFPNTPSIDIMLGLKHCNNKQALYFKVLNNFVQRYQSLQLNEIKSDERERTLHSLKGLTATLGMTNLSQLASDLEHSFESIKVNAFSQELREICQEILNIK